VLSFQAQSWSVDAIFQQQSGRARSSAVANPSLPEAAAKEQKMALVREANRSTAEEAPPSSSTAPNPLREERFSLPGWATDQPPREAHFRLKVYEKGNLVEVMQMGHKTASVIGRQRQGGACDFLLSHTTMSRKHAALIHHRDGTVRLLDLGSAHGTWVDGARVPAHEATAVREGSIIRFGQGLTPHPACLHCTCPIPSITARVSIYGNNH